MNSMTESQVPLFQELRIMMNQNPTENDPKSTANPPADAARKGEKPDKPSEIKRELTDEEIAGVAGGMVPPPKH
jgi:hypothetical protein